MTDEILEIKQAEKEALKVDPDNMDASPSSESAEDVGWCGNGKSSWVGGAVLIAIGSIFLVSNFTSFDLENWWALFILIPAISSLGNAWRVYKSNDESLGKEGRGSLIGGLVLLLVTATFLFGWNWSYIWPAFLIIGGLGLLLSAVMD